MHGGRREAVSDWRAAADVRLNVRLDVRVDVRLACPAHPLREPGGRTEAQRRQHNFRHDHRLRRKFLQGKDQLRLRGSPEERSSFHQHFRTR